MNDTNEVNGKSKLNEILQLLIDIEHLIRSSYLLNLIFMTSQDLHPHKCIKQI